VIRIEAPSRLHFGLLSLPREGFEPKAWLDSEGEPRIAARYFGGVGLMVEHPGIILTVRPSTAWSARGYCSARALAFAQTACAAWGISEQFEIRVERCPSEHIGLGTGTQLGLAVAQAIAMATGHCEIAVTDLARAVGRGCRSALGIHGFAQGGFLVEGGKLSPDSISPLAARMAFPEDWAVLLIRGNVPQGNHGQREAEAFQQLARLGSQLTQTDGLCRLVLLGMLPALVERDLKTFGAALYDFNRRVGEMFRPWQGGVYCHPFVAELIEGLREKGCKGVGQSSWGPTVFAVVALQDVAGLVEWLTCRYAIRREEITVTGARNQGAAASG
jgi:beta-ribofuranosylaminobenzene 5'-phosphate synthase